MKAPEFSLPDQNGEVQNLKFYHGKWILLYFYPGDFTIGCTKEACEFRDSIYEFDRRGVIIMGVSKDSVETHKKFFNKYNLNFILLSDETMETAKAYGAYNPKQFLGRPGVDRKTYLIDPKGELVKTYEKVNPLNHAGQILKDLDALTS